MEFWCYFTTELLLLIQTPNYFSIIRAQRRTLMLLSLAKGSNATLNPVTCLRQEVKFIFWHLNRLDCVTSGHNARVGIKEATVKTTGSGARDLILPHTSQLLTATISLRLSFSIFKMGSRATYSSGCCKDLMR